METFRLTGAVVALYLLLCMPLMASQGGSTTGCNDCHAVNNRSNEAGMTDIAAAAELSSLNGPTKRPTCFSCHSIHSSGIRNPIGTPPDLAAVVYAVSSRPQTDTHHGSIYYYSKMFSSGPPIPVVPGSL